MSTSSISEGGRSSNPAASSSLDPLPNSTTSPTVGHDTAKPWSVSQLFSYGASARTQAIVRKYSLGEEIANSVSHGIGALLSIAGIVLTVVFAVRDGGGVLLAAALAYSIPMFLEYTMSTLYHAIRNPKAKRVFRVLDHSMIYLYIAGSYTPFCLVTLADSGGLGLCVFVWLVAVVGASIEAFWVDRPRWVSAVVYLALGWCVVAYLPVLIQLLDPMGFLLLLIGGACFTVGCLFYMLKKVAYMHFVWHMFVLAGSVFQFMSILLFVL